MADPVIVRERPGGKYTQDVLTSRHHLFADEPETFGSADIGPTPYEYLCAALGACTTITLRMYAERKKWSVDHIACEVKHKKSVREGGQSHDVFTRTLSIQGELDDEQRQRMKEIANKCPVHRTLEHQAHVETELTSV